MEVKTSDFWIARSKTEYTSYENDGYIVWCSGVLVCLNEDGAPQSPLEVGRRAYEQKADYNQINGWFDLVVYSKAESGWLFFGDNSGSRFLYFDKEHGLFCDSLLALRTRLDHSASLNMHAAAQLFNMGRMLGEGTIVRGIHKTDPQYCYYLRNGVIERRSKALHAFSEMPDGVELDDIIGPTLEVIGNKRICAVCTGGTDSRAVLACLAHHDIYPDVVVTGHQDNPDISVAQKVADKLGVTLSVLDPTNKEADWLEKAFMSFDGAYDVVLGYRHLQKKRWAQTHGYEVEFGGVGGEFYKNSFCHFFRWGTDGSRAYLKKNLLISNGCNALWCGEKLRQANGEVDTQTEAILDDAMKEKTLLQRCNMTGFQSLACATGAITNGYGDTCCKIDPLTERRLIASASYRTPLSLSMHMWQRKTIHRHCPQLSEIETDQGCSCSLKPQKVLAERCKRLMFYTGLAVNRVKKKLGKGKPPQGYWNADYAEARNSERWAEAVSFCKDEGVIAGNIDGKQIPLSQTGWILLIGMMFGKGFNELASHGGEA